MLLRRKTGQASTILKIIQRQRTTKRKAINQGSTIRRIITKKAVMIRTSGEDREKRKSKNLLFQLSSKVFPETYHYHH